MKWTDDANSSAEGTSLNDSLSGDMLPQKILKLRSSEGQNSDNSNG